jgi:RNA polymerase sigma-70 factor (ECF subfamily)
VQNSQAQCNESLHDLSFDKLGRPCHHEARLRVSAAISKCLSGTFPPLPSSNYQLPIVSADDHRLILECLQGRSAAFGVLVCRYQDRLYNTVYRLLGNAEDTRDVVQDAFLHAYQSLSHFKGDSRFFTWLYRIAINTAISYKRKQRALLSIHRDREGGGGSEPLDTSEHAHPGYALEMAEEERRVQEALSRLSPQHRAVLVLKDIDGQKYEFIAEVLQVPVGTIRSRLHRARLELRQLLALEEGAGD